MNPDHDQDQYPTEALAQLVELYEARVEISITSECCWEGSLRVEATHADMAAMSSEITLRVGGCCCVECVAAELLRKFSDWQTDARYLGLELAPVAHTLDQPRDVDRFLDEVLSDE